MNTKRFTSKGKLLITGEYTVLDGALSLAIPSKIGQSLTVHADEKHSNRVQWLAYKDNGELWFECVFNTQTFHILRTNNQPFAETLVNIFIQVNLLESSLFNTKISYICETQLEFPENWGLGSSSTLINNIAKWAKVNPYQLLAKTFGGSGYDIACADAEGPITYQRLEENENPIVKDIFLPSEISKNLLFVYLNQKQNSREGIKLYKNKEKSPALIQEISNLTQKIISPNISFSEFSQAIQKHETLIADFLQLQKVKDKLFADYPGFIKSLGAWGGDFIMVERTKNAQDYFSNKGYKYIKEYEDFLL